MGLAKECWQENQKHRVIDNLVGVLKGDLKSHKVEGVKRKGGA